MITITDYDYPRPDCKVSLQYGPFSYVGLCQTCSSGEKFTTNMRKPAFCICENKDADQLRGNREADQRLCFRYIDSTIPLRPEYEISNL